MPFFIRKKQGKFSQKRKEKRKRPSTVSRNVKKTKKSKLNGYDEVISSDEEDVLSDQDRQDEDVEEDYSVKVDTRQEKKLCGANKYLKELKNEEGREEFIDDTKEAVYERLKEEALEEAGRLQKTIAHEYADASVEELFVLKGHKLSITCLVISSDEKHIYSASKDCSIIKWSLETGRKLKIVPGGRKGTESSHIGHTAHILSMALSCDDKFLATGCRNSIVNIWNPDTMELLKTFKGHKAGITGLVFQRESHQLISASSDRSLKLWNLDEMGYVETLFGHQDGITGIDCFHGEVAITSGGRDNTVRIWKIVQESQLVFHGHDISIDCICVSGLKHFVSGADDGSLSLWGTHRKKPLKKLPEVHGLDPDTGNPHWISSVCALRNSDLLASGSQNGEIKLWRREDGNNGLHLVSSIPVKGFVNSLSFSPSGKLLIAGVGQEHKLGRWWRIKDAKNVIVVYSWPNRS